ncbi:Protein of unknown function [Bacillus mobilis]|nr:Protein of unknown function [Bacillus mobilis]
MLNILVDAAIAFGAYVQPFMQKNADHMAQRQFINIHHKQS